MSNYQQGQQVGQQQNGNSDEDYDNNSDYNTYSPPSGFPQQTSNPYASAISPQESAAISQVVASTLSDGAQLPTSLPAADTAMNAGGVPNTQTDIPAGQASATIGNPDTNASATSAPTNDGQNAPLSVVTSTANHGGAPAASGTGEAASDSTRRPTSFTQYQHQRNSGSGPGTGVVAAAVVVPIVVLLGLAMFGLVCLRRRRRRRAHPHRQQQRYAGDGPQFLPMLREKWAGSLRSNSSETEPRPELTGGRTEMQNAYMTGIDTRSSHHYSGNYARSEGGTFVDAPPPYAHHAQRPGDPTPNTDASPYQLDLLHHRQQDPPSSQPQSSPGPYHLDLLHLRTDQHNDVPPVSPASTQNPRALSPVSPISPTAPPAAAQSASSFLTPTHSLRTPTRSGSARSITSTLYSDTASVHSARAARRSVGGPFIVEGQTGRRSGEDGGDGRERGDPFGDDYALR